LSLHGKWSLYNQVTNLQAISQGKLCSLCSSVSEQAINKSCNYPKDVPTYEERDVLTATRMVDKGTLQDFGYAVKCIRDEMKSKAPAIFFTSLKQRRNTDIHYEGRSLASFRQSFPYFCVQGI
jgi:hypothetical protein